MYPALLALAAVTMRPVRIISRKPRRWGILRDCTPTAFRSWEAKRQSVLDGDIERSAEMTGPLTEVSQNQIVP